MFARLVGESFVRNPRRKVLAVSALVVGMAVTTANLMMALDVGDRLAREFRSFGANLLVTPKSDTLPLEIGGVDYRPVDEGAYLNEADLGKLKTIFWRHNIIGFTPFLDVPVTAKANRQDGSLAEVSTILIGTWYEHEVAVPDGSKFKTGARITNPWWKVRGRWFAEPQETGNSHSECLVGSTLATSHRIEPGDALTLRAGDRSASVTVAGVVSTGGPEDDAVVAPLSLAQELSAHPRQFRQLFVSALTKPEDAFSQRDPQTMTPKDYDRWYCSPYISSIGHQIQQVLPGTNARPIRRLAETEGRILSRVSALLWLVTLAALVAAGLAVAATAATTVLERRTEVGLMKALGATNTLVAGIFVAEQVFLAIVGGAIGFLVGAGLARLLGESVFGTPASLRPILLPVILAIAVLVALTGSLVPLRRASHFDPAPILRGE
ncbi:MAG: ABC transporter permease [Candidatus Acidiferrales bacterium]